jgi:hypothetical protein
MNKVCALLLILVLVTGPVVTVFSQTNAGSLPLVLVTFNASLGANRQVVLSWTVQQQFTAETYEVEKSTDGLRWASIVTVNAAGISSRPVTYNAVDNTPLKGSNLYRLRISSTDGNTGYSIVKNVTVDAPVGTRLYPNPSVGLLTISLAAHPVADYWTLALVNHLGQVMVQKKYHNSETKICLPVGNYPNGNYVLQITDGSSRQSNILMINHQ